jgi:tetratricopeptide (TPR) repeat protein
LVLATALFNTRFDAGEEVLKEIDAGLEFYPGSRTLLTSRMEVLAALGRRDEALAAGLAAAGGPERNLRADAVRVVCLSRLARHEEAEHLFRELDRDQSDLSPAWRRAIRCQLLLRRDPERAAEVRSADETEAFAILPAAARALLDPALGESPRPAAALPFLRELGARLGALPPADGIFHFSPGTSPQLLDRAMALRSLDRPNLTRDHAVLRARAHLLLGERAEAERWLREAEATGRSNRDLLVLQRDLAAGKGR